MASLTSSCKPFTSIGCTQTKKVNHKRGSIVRCSLNPEQGSDRRSVLAGLASLAVLPLAASPAFAGTEVIEKEVPVSALNVFQKKDIVTGLKVRAIAELKKVLTDADASFAVRLLLNDAAAGGVNGSIILSEELGRPENKDLKPYVEKLAVAKKAIDATAPAGQIPISWADTIVLGTKVAVEKKWVAEKLLRAKGNANASATKYAPTEFQVSVGRVDATSPDPAGRLPAADASPADVLAFMKTLDPPTDGSKPPFRERQTFLLWTAARDDPEAAEEAFAAASADFAELKKKYDKSRRTFSRTSYEVDLVEYINKLSNVGAKYDSNAYLFPLKLALPKRL